jgi:hypothetical protein
MIFLVFVFIIELKYIFQITRSINNSLINFNFLAILLYIIFKLITIFRNLNWCQIIVFCFYIIFIYMNTANNNKTHNYYIYNINNIINKSSKDLYFEMVLKITIKIIVATIRINNTNFVRIIIIKKKLQCNHIRSTRMWSVIFDNNLQLMFIKIYYIYITPKLYTCTNSIF